MLVRCDTCGLESTAEEAYHRLQITRKKSRLYCPACWAKYQAKWSRNLLLAAVVAAIVGVGLLKLVPDGRHVAWQALSFALFVLVEVLCIVPHELGHAIAAWLTGMRVFTISIGSFGGIAYVARIFGYDVVLRTIPLGGSVLVAPKSTRFVRLRYLFVVFCGPLANACLIGLGMQFGGSLNRQSTAYWALSVFVVANLVILAVNLVPRKVWCGNQKVSNDGLAMLTTPFMSRAVIEAWHRMYFFLEGLEARERGRFQEAKGWFERAAASAPENAATLNGLAVSLLDLREYDKSRRLLQSLVERDDNPPDFHSDFCNNLAWVDLLIGTEDLVQEALHYSELAIARKPWASNYKGTRGAALACSGDLEAGIGLLQEALRENYSPEERACNASMLALAMLKQGDDGQARRYLEKARRLDANCPLLERAEREIAVGKAV